jgi:hypothetical protein
MKEVSKCSLGYPELCLTQDLYRQQADPVVDPARLARPVELVIDLR